MKRILVALVLVCIVSPNVYSQYADLGTGALKDKIWWFDWNGFTMANGASKTFNTPDGLTVTISFSAVQGPLCQPTIMNTWPGAVLRFLYDFSNPAIKPAFYSPNTTQNCDFTLNVTATRNGIPAAFKFIAADAEGSDMSENIKLTTNAGAWSCIDFFRNSSQTSNPFLGCNTTSATLVETYGFSAGIGQNPVIATDASNTGSLTVRCVFNWPTVPGRTGIAFGIFAPNDRGDLPASYGYAQHLLTYTGVNPCNFLPPLPSIIQSESLKLGTVAGDADGAESTNDNAAGADEDGVSVFPIYTNSGSYSLTVNVANTTGNNCYLTGWFDFNRNGTFDNNEFVTNTIANNATSSVITWTGLPANLPGNSLSPCAFRFRLSSNLASTQSATGFAIDGEVEDYVELITLNNVAADFSIPDTVCVRQPVTVQNLSQNATSYFWNFCSGSLNTTPTFSNSNLAGITQPAYMDFLQDGPDHYAFVVNQNGTLARMSYGTNILTAPTVTNLGSFGGILPNKPEGIAIEKDGINWIGYLVGGENANSRLLRLNFGASITNIPVITNLGNIGGLDSPKDLTLYKDGTTWYGFTVNADGNAITKFTFGNSLINAPLAQHLGNIGTLSYPTGVFLIKDAGNYHLFITNRNSSTLSRLDFGVSLANIPAGINLGNPGNIFNGPRDIAVTKDCEKIFGFVVNENSSFITRLDFNNDLLSAPSAFNLGNIGGLSFPYSISEIIRPGNGVIFSIPNLSVNPITRITFTNCPNSSIPNSIATTPPAFQYNQPGTYNVSLYVDEGLPTQTVVCKQIVVKDCGRSITGIVNDYTEVLGFDICKNILRVTDASVYKVGDTVLLIQMKGAAINNTNTAAFGSITDYKNAGNYEFNYIKSKTGNNIELKNVLTRQYDIPGGVVQLVRVPYYQKAVVNATLTCLPWDGSKGGIVAINVMDTLTLNNNIDVSGKGFRGGLGTNTALLVTNCFTNDYFYPSPSTIAANKGEGIAILSNTNNRGKGLAANAGGGGLDHNSGGGGGGNGGMGGFGGYQLEPCGNAPFDNRGIGGLNLPYNNISNRIFAGGGGGAGHANNPADINFPSSGGNGGGIVIISAQKILSNSFKITANGADAPGCPVATTNDCHDAMGGGGAGGTVLLNVADYIQNTSIEIKGGKGADVSGSVPLGGRIGAGGGGGGGVFWTNNASMPVNASANISSGLNGLLLQDNNNAWGATPGNNGTTVYGLQLPVDIIPFKPNIDSVRIKNTITGCKSFDFEGLGYTNTHAVADWQWYFGDGDTANTQNTSHAYSTGGAYTVKLVITDINGCKDSITTQVNTTSLNLDFTYQPDICNSLSVQFTGTGAGTQNFYWSFGDATTLTGTLNPVHVYPSQNTYIVKYSAGNGVCIDTVTKTINLAILQEDIVITPDTTICLGTDRRLRTRPALSFCWSPVTYLDNPLSPNPLTSTPENITYKYTAQVTGTNLIINPDFSQGNTGFTSQYTYKPPPNVLGAEYYAGPDPQAWNVGMTPCGDHTTGTGNMMLVNGSSVDNVIVWSQTVAVQPNTNYAFSTWIQDISGVSPATLQFSINGINTGAVFQSGTVCTWQQFYTTWNSGNNTTAVISIVNRNLILFGNDFALDDISFAPVYTFRDSVIITVDTPFVKTSGDDAICPGKQVQLNTTPASIYAWTPAAGLTNTGIGNPVATPLATTEYIVTATNANGCTAKDSVTITVYPKPLVTTSADDIICKNTPVQLSATGGGTYAWSPAATLDDATAANPTATPAGYTRYYVTVTDANTCTNIDSIDINIHPDPVFSISPADAICEKDSVRLTAAGGDIYTWHPAASLSNAAVASPRAGPAVTTDYSVDITESNCNTTATLHTTITVNPLPDVQADKSGDLDCSNDRSQLIATGARSYTWSPASSLTNHGIENPVATPDITTKYIVKGTDAMGCSNYDSVIVNFAAVNTSGYYMPNAFTPNHDGLNDCYGIKFWGAITSLEFSVYNRWGERLFFTKNPNDCWNGIYKGKMQDIGVYVYVIKAKTVCGDTFKKGLFTLAR